MRCPPVSPCLFLQTEGHQGMVLSPTHHPLLQSRIGASSGTPHLQALSPVLNLQALSEVLNSVTQFGADVARVPILMDQSLGTSYDFYFCKWGGEMTPPSRSYGGDGIREYNCNRITIKTS